MTDQLTLRIEMLLARLRTSYDGIGHSSGRPYIYFVYDPAEELQVRRLVDDHLRSDGALQFYHLDLLLLTIAALQGQEDRRRALLMDERAPGAAGDVLRLWTRRLLRAVATEIETPAGPGRPVIVLRGLAALHPMTNPTALMESIAEQEPRDPTTDRILPIVLLVPGLRPPQSSRQYRFLGLDHRTLSFYRGEEL
jgi:hypothetical protein